MAETLDTALLEILESTLKSIRDIRSLANICYNSTEIFDSNASSDVNQDSPDESMIFSPEEVQDLPSEWITSSTEEIRDDFLNLFNEINNPATERMELSHGPMEDFLNELSNICHGPIEDFLDGLSNISHEPVEDALDELIEHFLNELTNISHESIGNSPDEPIEHSLDELTNISHESIGDSPDELVIFSHETIRDSHESMDSDRSSFESINSDGFNSIPNVDAIQIQPIDSDDSAQDINSGSVDDAHTIRISISDFRQIAGSSQDNFSIYGNLMNYIFSILMDDQTAVTNSLEEPVPLNPLPKEILESLPIKNVDEKIMNELEICSICSEKYSLEEQVLLLPCTHVFHVACIKRWFIENSSCPMCRRLVE